MLKIQSNTNAIFPNTRCNDIAKYYYVGKQA